MQTNWLFLDRKKRSKKESVSNIRKNFSGIPRHHKPTVNRFKTTLLTQWFSGVPLNIYKDAKSIAPQGLVKDTAQVNFDDFKMLRSTRGTFQLNREKEKTMDRKNVKKRLTEYYFFEKEKKFLSMILAHMGTYVSQNVCSLVGSLLYLTSRIRICWSCPTYSAFGIVRKDT